jgi:DNA-binding CsgD family transcriptional regulator
VFFSINQMINKYFGKTKGGNIKPQHQLTELEQKIIQKISVGKSYQTIADELSIRGEDVQKQIRIIYEKLQHKSNDNK